MLARVISKQVESLAAFAPCIPAFRTREGLYHAECPHGFSDAHKARDIRAQHIVAGLSVFLRFRGANVMNAAHDLGQPQFRLLESPAVARSVLLHFQREGRHATGIGGLAGAKQDARFIPVGEALVLAEKIADPTPADPDVAGRNVSVLDWQNPACRNGNSRQAVSPRDNPVAMLYRSC